MVTDCYIAFLVLVTHILPVEPCVIITSWSFRHSWNITGFVTRLTRRMPLVEQELLTLPEHLRSPPVFSGVRITRSLVLCLFIFRIIIPFIQHSLYSRSQITLAGYILVIYGYWLLYSFSASRAPEITPCF
jgi:hypothetical protein